LVKVIVEGLDLRYVSPFALFPAEEIELIDHTEVMQCYRRSVLIKFCNPNCLQWVKRHSKGESLGTEEERRWVTKNLPPTPPSPLRLHVKQMDLWPTLRTDSPAF